MPRASIWQSIADALREEITAGTYAPGQKLPTEALLSGRFGVNRHTIRRALAELSNEGLVWARRGSGVFVSAPPPTTYALGKRVRFHSQISASGRLPSKQVLALETRMANPDEAAALNLAKGARVHVYDGLSFADQLPIAVFKSIFPAERLPRLLDKLQSNGSVTAALRAEGVEDYTRAKTELTASIASELEARHLRLNRGAPVLRSVAINIDALGDPVELGHTAFVGDRVTLYIGDG